MTESLNILMFCAQFRPMVGGAERQAEKLAKALVALGVRVTVLTPALVPGLPVEERDTGVIIRRFPLVDITRRLPGVRGLGSVNLLGLQIQIARAVDPHMRGASVLHAHMAGSLAAFVAQSARRRAVPVICKVGMAMAGGRSDLTELARMGSGGPRLARSMIRNVDRWIATTDAVRLSLVESGINQTRIESIPNGVELPLETGQSLRRGAVRHFLYLGRISANSDRDVPTLVRAFDRLADEEMDVQLSIVGDGDLLGSVEALVSTCRNAARIQLPGQQAPEPWLNWADCLVLPSRREGLSNALLEAMSAGLVCIANDIPANREVLAEGSAGILTPVGNEDALLHALRSVCRDSQLPDGLRRSGYARARSTYDINAVAARYVSLYERLASFSATKVKSL
jgi:glycosyltransferase involved in cell wall biosynthesis